MPKINTIYRAAMTDAGRRLCDGGEMARKTLVCSYHGRAFVAEREGDELHVFHVGGDSIPSNTLGDRRNTSTSMTGARLQAQIEATRLGEKNGAW
jgi:hypothetical protein